MNTLPFVINCHTDSICRWQKELDRTRNIGYRSGQAFRFFLLATIPLLWILRRWQQNKRKSCGKRVYRSAPLGVAADFKHHVLIVGSYKYEISEISKDEGLYCMRSSRIDTEDIAEDWPDSYTTINGRRFARYKHKLLGWTKLEDDQVRRICEHITKDLDYDTFKENCHDFIDQAAPQICTKLALYSSYWYTDGNRRKRMAFLAVLDNPIIFAPLDLLAVVWYSLGGITEPYVGPAWQIFVYKSKAVFCYLKKFVKLLLLPVKHLVKRVSREDSRHKRQTSVSEAYEMADTDIVPDYTDNLGESNTHEILGSVDASDIARAAIYSTIDQPPPLYQNNQLKNCDRRKRMQENWDGMQMRECSLLCEIGMSRCKFHNVSSTVR